MLFRTMDRSIKPQDQNIGDKILVGIKSNSSLKPRIEEAQQNLQQQISKQISHPPRGRKRSKNKIMKPNTPEVLLERSCQRG
jgi:hypothetical protein